MAVIVSAGFGMIQVFSAPHLWWTGAINIVGAVIYATIPWLYRFGELVPPLTFICTAYVSIFVICWIVGTGSGLQFYFLVASCLVVLQLGVDRCHLGVEPGQPFAVGTPRAFELGAYQPWQITEALTSGLPKRSAIPGGLRQRPSYAARSAGGKSVGQEICFCS